MEPPPPSHEPSSSSESGDDRAKDAAAIALARLDLQDELALARRDERRRWRYALGVTLVAPVNFLVQALVFWRDGWPPAGPAVLAVMTAASALFWVPWRATRKERLRVERELEALPPTSSDDGTDPDASGVPKPAGG